MYLNNYINKNFKSKIVLIINNQSEFYAKIATPFLIH
jgi:hypothetical protein